MKILGITGSSGAGKSTFSKFLSEKQEFRVIDADKVSKELAVPGNEYLDSIKNTFGEDILLDDGNLNRKLLASKIYNNEEEREKLNSLTVKYILKEIYNRMKKIVDPKVKYIAVDAPLLFETGFDKVCDYVVSLIAEKYLKIERICQRDNIDYETAVSRLNSQKSASFYTENADFVIMSGKNCNLKEEADKLLFKLEQKEKKPNDEVR